MDCLLIEKDGPVTILTLNRPEARNAISPELIVRLDAACLEAKDDPDVRAVVIAASKSKIFCAGGDLKLTIPLITGARKPEDEFDEATLKLAKERGRPFPMEGDIGKPLIAAVDGAALGGGLELVLAADLVVAGSGASFGAPEASVGAYPARLTYLLPQRLPYSIASKMLMACLPLSAEDAGKYGLLTELVDAGAARERALELAHNIATNAPISVQGTRAVARAYLQFAETETARLDREQAKHVYQSKDAREGPRAFAEKRKPDFKGV